jgi:hypothetical protein
MLNFYGLINILLTCYNTYLLYVEVVSIVVSVMTQPDLFSITAVIYIKNLCCGHVMCSGLGMLLV